MELYHIEHHKSSPYRPQTNGAVEAANKEHQEHAGQDGSGIHKLGQKTPIRTMGLQNFYSSIN